MLRRPTCRENWSEVGQTGGRPSPTRTWRWPGSAEVTEEHARRGCYGSRLMLARVHLGAFISEEGVIGRRGQKPRR